MEKMTTNFRRCKVLLFPHAEHRIDFRAQAILRLRRKFDPFAIDKHYRRPIDPERSCPFLIGRDAPGYDIAIHVLAESIEIEPHLARACLEEWANIIRPDPV